MHLRITYAKELLETTALPVTEVAFHSGFANVSYLYEVLKTVTVFLHYNIESKNYNSFNALEICTSKIELLEFNILVLNFWRKHDILYPY